MPYLYSDLAGVGAYARWTYHGPALSGPVAEFWGTQPILNPTTTYPQLKDGDQGLREGGVLLPGGVFLPGQSYVGDQDAIAMKLEVDGKSYGASLHFTLKDGPNGFTPAQITVSPLLPAPTP